MRMHTAKANDKIPVNENGEYVGDYEDQSEEEACRQDNSRLGRLLRRSRRSRVMNIPVPPFFYDKSYHQLVKYMMLELQLVPLGLYRGVCKRYGISESGNEHPYVVTNPDPMCKVSEVDGMFVLGPMRDLLDLKSAVMEMRQEVKGKKGCQKLD